MTLQRHISTLAAVAAVTGAAASMLLCGGCQSADCQGLRSSVLRAGFYSRSTEEPVGLDSISVGGIGAPDDSLLVKAGQTVGFTYLPLRSAVPSTSFIIRYDYAGLNDDACNDTITFDYTSIPYFESPECGAMYRYRIDRIGYTRHLIDSIGCSDSLINNIDIEQLQIYFNVYTPDRPGEASAASPKGGPR